MKQPKTAVIHEWLVSRGGAESVLESFLTLWPSPVYTFLHEPSVYAGTALAAATVRPSFLQRIPGATRNHRAFLPFFPLAAESFDLKEFDLVLSISHCAAKGVLTRPDQLHLTYCLTPARYAWDLQEEYLKETGLDRGLRGAAARSILKAFRSWDLRSARRPDGYSTLSKYIAERIRRRYGLEAEVIYPPVDVDRFVPTGKRESYFFTASRLVPYKKIPLLASVFRRAGLPLIIAGDGPERSKVEAECGGAVRYVGRVPDQELKDLMAGARGFVFAAEEDFGIAPVEAQACGVPVLALGKGAAAETVLDGKTGVLFAEPTPISLEKGLKEFMKKEDSFDPAVIRAHAEGFSRPRFEREMRAFVERRWARFQEDPLSVRPQALSR